MNHRRRMLGNLVIFMGILLLGGVLAGGLPGCSGCGGKAPLAFVPMDADVVLIVPSMRQALHEAKSVFDRFADQPIFQKMYDQGKAHVLQELGLDLEKPDTWKSKGINPDSGLVASLSGDGQSLSVVFGEDDAKTLEKYLRETMTRLYAGDATFSEKDFSGVTVTLLLRQGRETPALAWTHVSNYTILCPKAKGGRVGEYVAEVARLKQSLKKNKTYAELAEKIGQHHVLLYLDGVSLEKTRSLQEEEDLKSATPWMKDALREKNEILRTALSYFRGAAFGLSVSREEMALRVHIATPEGKTKTIRDIFRGKGDSPRIDKYLGADSLLIGRISLDAKKLLESLMELAPPRIKRSIYSEMAIKEREVGLSLEKDVLALLAGRYAFALFSPDVSAFKSNLSHGFGYALEHSISMLGMVQVAETAKTEELLARVERFLIMEHADVRTKTTGENKIYYVDPSADGQQVCWTLFKDLLLVATGDRLDKTLDLIKRGGDTALSRIKNPTARDLLKTDEDVTLFFFDLNRAMNTLRSAELPMQIKLLLNTTIAPLNNFSDVMVVFKAEDSGVAAELAIRLNKN
jgi:hypothetical protein